MFMFCPPDETHDPSQPLAAAAKKKCSTAGVLVYSVITEH